MNGSIKLSEAMRLAEAEARKTRSTRYVYRDTRGYWNVARTRPLLAVCREVGADGAVRELPGPLEQGKQARNRPLIRSR